MHSELGGASPGRTSNANGSGFSQAHNHRRDRRHGGRERDTQSYKTDPEQTATPDCVQPPFSRLEIRGVRATMIAVRYTHDKSFLLNFRSIQGVGNFLNARFLPKHSSDSKAIYNFEILFIL